jgi:hypothetical protein
MYNLDCTAEGVCWKYHGAVSGKEIIEISRIIYGGTRFDHLKYQLVDFIDAESIRMDTDEIEEITSHHCAAAISNPEIKTAIVIKDSYVRQDTSFAALFKESSWQVKVFQGLDEARGWPGIGPSSLQPRQTNAHL